MDEIISLLVYLALVIGIVSFLKKQLNIGGTQKRYNNSNRPTPTAYNNSNPYASQQPVAGSNQSFNWQNASRPQQTFRQEPSAVPHVHRAQGQYDTFNKKSIFNESGTMPHKHETGHYTSMPDASKLPKGYILLNGEPVRVADLENK